MLYLGKLMYRKATILLLRIVRDKSGLGREYEIITPATSAPQP